ncbi:MAG: hypothetical protein WCO84_01515 [bacterium]
MNYPDGKRINIGGEWYTFKSYLTFGDILFIVQETIKALENGVPTDDGGIFTDSIVGYNKNIMVADYIFNRHIIAVTCEELLELDYSLLLANNVFDELYNISGVPTANQYVRDIIENKNSVEYILENFLSKVVEKLPDTKELQKLSKSVIKELGSAKNKDLIDNLKDVFKFKAENII